jgi:ring-1,2-phenylacetyl-CoA epoxidase subunit PaaB
MSKFREHIPEPEGDLPFAAEGDYESYEVFIQLNRGDQHKHAGSVDAPDAELALQFAREHYGQDQPCVNMWVIPRSAIASVDQEHTMIWRSTDQSYRLARGYSRDVRQKWEAVRAAADVDQYQSEDLKQTF